MSFTVSQHATICFNIYSHAPLLKAILYGIVILPITINAVEFDYVAEQVGMRIPPIQLDQAT